MEQINISRKQKTLIVVGSVLLGFLISVFWSASFVDSDLGDPIANNLLGYDAKTTPITGIIMGALFAFVSGLAGTFTACNICAFSAIAPLSSGKRSTGSVLKPLGFLSLGLIVVAALYGGIGALIGSNLPQLSTEQLSNGMPVRLLQSVVVFCLIGITYIIWGLGTIKVIPNPFSKFFAKHVWAAPFIMGATIGAFLIGRPFPLFRKMFEYAASTHNPFYGSLAFVLQGIGNIIVMAVLFLILFYGTGGRFEKWLNAKTNRVVILTAVLLIVSGTFFLSYWGPRILARNNIVSWPYFDWTEQTIKFQKN
ncbi:MAG: hypothetical protein WC087_01015 [Candidatus Paceibacterota bacterium]